MNRIIYPNDDGGVSIIIPSPEALETMTIEEIWNKQHSLQELLDPKNFKTYDELKRRLSTVLGDTKVADEREEEEEEAPPPKQKAAPQSKSKASAPKKQAAADDDEDEDSLEFFKRIAEEDE